MREAREKDSEGLLDYYEGGALDEITLRENMAGWERLKLYYRVLAGVKARDLRNVLGQPISMPIAVAPTAFHKLACDTGEIATARAAKAPEHCLFSARSRTRRWNRFFPKLRPALVSALCLQGPRDNA